MVSLLSSVDAPAGGFTTGWLLHTVVRAVTYGDAQFTSTGATVWVQNELCSIAPSQVIETYGFSWREAHEE